MSKSETIARSPRIRMFDGLRSKMHLTPTVHIPQRRRYLQPEEHKLVAVERRRNDDRIEARLSLDA